MACPHQVIDAKIALISAQMTANDLGASENSKRAQDIFVALRTNFGEEAVLRTERVALRCECAKTLRDQQVLHAEDKCAKDLELIALEQRNTLFHAPVVAAHAAAPVVAPAVAGAAPVPCRVSNLAEMARRNDAVRALRRQAGLPV